MENIIKKVKRGIRRRQVKTGTRITYNKPVSILWISDPQIKSGIDLRFIYAIGQLIAIKQPDIIIGGGDVADMPSLSSYDKFKKSYEGQRYKNDIESVITAQKVLWDPLEGLNAKLRVQRKEIYNPFKLMLLGNHEDRIDRAIELDPMLEGSISIEDLRYSDYWDAVYDFLQVVTIQGIAFSHYFGTGVMNKPAATAQVQLNKMHMSCVSGHQPGRQTANGRAGDGRLLTSIISGSSYPHDLKYMGKQGNIHWRGVVMMHNAIDGIFDEVYIPTEYLINKYTTGMGPIVFSPKRRKSEGG